MGELGEFPSSVEKLGARCQPTMIGRQLGILPSQSPNCSGSLVLTETKFVPDEIHQVRAIFPVVNRERGIKPELVRLAHHILGQALSFGGTSECTTYSGEPPQR